MKKYMKPSIKCKEWRSCDMVCLSKYDGISDDDQLSRRGFFDDEEENVVTFVNVWDD
jgi:hypothetical protein